ncbi:MAG TPA: signal peptide peptidase SppA [Phycisphaeraceae bacterium]
MRITSIIVIGWMILAASGCGPLSFSVGPAPIDQRLTRTKVLSDGRWFSDRVAVIDVSGLLLSVEKPELLQPGENPLGSLHEKLAEAADDPRVKAVILRLNTPGGTVTASDAMHREVQRFRQTTGKPVVALMMDVAASGGYYLACAADRIVAYPTTVTGSIGVIVQTLSLQPALARIGVQAQAITSGPNKEAGSPLSTLTPEHRQVLQNLVDDFYARFVEVVRHARPQIPQEEFARVTDGRVMSGEAAAALGLVDRTGDIYDAFALAKQLAGIESADLVLYHRPLQYVASPYAVAPVPAAGTQVNLVQLNVGRLLGFDTPVGVYYLWQPNLP